MGHDIVYYNHFNFRFCSYVEAHNYHKFTNDVEDQTSSSICLGTTANFQGSYKMFSLRTGNGVTLMHNIRDIPMPKWVIRHIESLTTRDIRYLSNCNESLLVDHFSNKNYFSAALHEGGIAGVMQDDDDYNDNSDEKPKPEPDTETVVDPNSEYPDEIPSVQST